MAIVESATIECRDQEDWTGKDDVALVINGTRVAQVRLGDGQKKTVSGSGHPQTNWLVEPGSTIVFEELDSVDPNDVLARHTVTQADIARGSIRLTHKVRGVDYAFEVRIVDF